MEYIASREEMQRIDAYNIEELGIPGIVLMERASLTLADEISARFSADTDILVVAERGNNGGDGLAAGRILLSRGYRVSFYEIGAVGKATDSYRTQREILYRLGADFLTALPEEDPQVWIDAIFGVGLSREVKGLHRQVIEEMNRRSGYVVSVDLPSGLDASDGRIRGAAVRADLTVTFGLLKAGLLLYPGAEYAGEVLVKEMGFMPESIRAIGPRMLTYTRDDLFRLPARKAWSNKGNYGKILMIAGCRNMAGAALLSGRAAYRSGAGLVRILTGESNRQILQTGLPDAVLSTYDDRDDLVNPDLIADLDQALEWADVIGIGPGLGLSARARIFLHKVLSEGRVPLVIDADGINNLAVMLKESTEIRTLYKDYPYGIIMTPHPGEMCRLTGRPVRDIVTNLVDTASSFADENHVIVLKDARTVIAGGGPYIYLNRSGNSGMAVGGSGDVLTGMICGILGQYGPDSFSQDGGDRQAILVHAVRLAVYCHGMAGDLAAKEKGQRGLMASDLPDAAARIMDPGFDPDQGGTSLPGGRHTGKFLIENDGGGVFG